jgi:hypothetical protein
MGSKNRDWNRGNKAERTMLEECAMHCDPRNYDQARRIVLDCELETMRKVDACEARQYSMYAFGNRAR